MICSVERSAPNKINEDGSAGNRAIGDPFVSRLVQSCRLNHIFERYFKACTCAVRRDYTKCFGSIGDD